MRYRILTVGWEPAFIDELLAPIERAGGVEFVHGLVGDAARLAPARQRYPHLNFVALSKQRHEPLPAPDLALLAALEGPGVPTLRSMIQGDRVLRHRPADEALGYATLLATRIRAAIGELQPQLVMASFDSLHSGISLAVAKSLALPWVAMAFPVIPDTLTGFCNALVPDSLVALGRPVDEQLREQARTLIRNVRAKNQKIAAFRAPASLAQWLRQYLLHGRNLLRRNRDAALLGIDRLTYPTKTERLHDVLRRSLNRLRLPAADMLRAPPPGRFAYYPFHMAPESMLDTWAPFYQNQLAFVAQLSLAMPADMTLAIKLHFSDPDNYSRQQLQQLLKLPQLRIAHPDASGRAFTEAATLVIGIQGTTCLEAALLGKPVLIFGESPYVHFPRSQRARQPDELHEQIRGMLTLPPPDDEEIAEAFAAYMARYMPGRINDWTRPLVATEISQLVECFRALCAYADDPVNRTNWYRAAAPAPRRDVLHACI